MEIYREKAKENKRVRESKQVSSQPLFHCQETQNQFSSVMPTMDLAGMSSSQELETQSKSPSWVAGIHVLDPSMPPPRDQIRSKLGSGAKPGFQSRHSIGDEGTQSSILIAMTTAHSVGRFLKIYSLYLNCQNFSNMSLFPLWSYLFQVLCLQ